MAWGRMTLVMVWKCVMPMAFAPSVWPGSMEMMPPRTDSGHIRARIDGDDQDGRGPDVIKAQGVVGKVRQGVEDEDGLQHHGRAAEDLDVDADDDAEDLQEDALGPGGRFWRRGWY